MKPTTHVVVVALLTDFRFRLDLKVVDAVLASVPYRNWQEGIEKIENEDKEKPNLYIESIHVQGVDMFGPRVGFSKLKVFSFVGTLIL